MLDHVTATRYVTPLREGGSLPGIVEADDDGTYVVKFRGAGQGVKVLVAEIIVAGLSELIGIRTPRVVLIDLPPAIARFEADEEVQDLLNASPGLNLGVDFLPRAFGYDGSRPATREESAAVMWLDALTANVDRTWANPNLLVWHGDLWAIDHGAALYFHHSWPRRAPDAQRFADQPFDLSTHVLRDLAEPGRGTHEALSPLLAPEAVERVLASIPDEWLEPTSDLPTPGAIRTAYAEHLAARLANPQGWWAP